MKCITVSSVKEKKAAEVLKRQAAVTIQTDNRGVESNISSERMNRKPSSRLLFPWLSLIST